MQITTVKNIQVGEAHSYYDIVIHCNLPPAKAEDLAEKLRKLLNYKCIICDDYFPEDELDREFMEFKLADGISKENES